MVPIEEERTNDCFVLPALWLVPMFRAALFAVLFSI